MSMKVREAAETILDDLLTGKISDEINEITDWVEELMPVTSQRDLAIGFAIGTFMTTALIAIAYPKSSWKLKQLKDKEAVKAMVKQGIPKIVEKPTRARIPPN